MTYKNKMARSVQQLEHIQNIIKKRWPTLFASLTEEAQKQPVEIAMQERTIVVNSVQLTSAYNPEAEAKLQISQIPRPCKNAFLYGIGLGYAPQFLLNNTEIDELHVVILNRTVFFNTLQFLEEHDWLFDKRTQLHLPGDVPEIRSPFAVNPAELILAENSAAQLRDRLELELNHVYATQSHLQEESLSQQAIRANLPFLEKDEDITSLSLQLGETVFVAAAGPTLEAHLHWLSQHDTKIIAVDAAAPTLILNGITPDIIVSIDPEVIFFFDNIPNDMLKGISLVYFPTADGKLLKRWPGKRYFSAGNTKMYQTVPKQYRQTPLFNAGSVLHPAVDLARFCGATQIILLGADFSFVNNKSHANAEQSEESLLDIKKATHWVLNSHGKKVATTPNFKGYLRDLERYIEKHSELQFFNGSPLGAKIEGTKPWIP